MTTTHQRGYCPACGRNVALRLDGTLRLHRAAPGIACIGSYRAATHAGDALLERLEAVADDLSHLDPGGPVERDLRLAVSRIVLAERAAQEAIAARRQIRSLPAGVE